MSIQLTIVLMLLAHLVADYTLQGWLADGKQRSWWEKMCIKNLDESLERTKYRFDYLMALVCHSLYWSILVCIPFHGHQCLWIAVVANTIVHSVIDDLKANRFKLNLIQDQILHLCQIAATAYFMI